MQLRGATSTCSLMGCWIDHSWGTQCATIGVTKTVVTWAYSNVTQNSVYLQLCLEINFNVG